MLERTNSGEDDSPSTKLGPQAPGGGNQQLEEIRDWLTADRAGDKEMASINKIRVLHVVHSLNRGGIETWLYHVLRGLDRTRFHMDFAVATETPSHYDQQFRELGAGVYPCSHATQPWRYGRDFARLLKEQGPYDIVHSHFDPCGYPLVWAHRAGIPIRVAHSHNTGRELRSKSRLLQIMFSPLTRRWIQSHATAGMAASSDAALAMFGKGWSTDPRWEVLPCGIDFEPYCVDVGSQAMRSELGLPLDRLVIGHVGKFSAFPQKNQAFLLEVAAAANRRRPIHVLLVGDGPTRAEAEQKAAQLGIAEDVTFLGSRDDVPRLLEGAMDVFLFPSLFEGLGLAIVEAQAAGLPCVASDSIPNEADVVKELVTRLSLEESVETWANELLRIAAGPLPVAPSDALAQVRQSNFDIRNAVANLQTRYMQLTEQAGASRPMVEPLPER